jgi:hypothetical protein
MASAFVLVSTDNASGALVLRPTALPRSSSMLTDGDFTAREPALVRELAAQQAELNFDPAMR